MSSNQPTAYVQRLIVMIKGFELLLDLLKTRNRFQKSRDVGNTFRYLCDAIANESVKQDPEYQRNVNIFVDQFGRDLLRNLISSVTLILTCYKNELAREQEIV